MNAQPFPLSNEAQRYAWRELARRAGLPLQSAPGTGFEALNLPVVYGPPGPPAAEWRPALYILPAVPSCGQELLSLPPARLDWLPSQQALPPGARSALDERLPILFWGADHAPGQPFAELRQDGALIFHADLLAATFFMLSRWEETVILERDPFGRFLGQSSAASRQNFADRPVIDEYGLILRAWLQALFPAWTPAPGHFAVELSHDIDHISIPWAMRVRLALKDLLRLHNLPHAWNAFVDGVLVPWQDPLLKGLRLLSDLSARHGFDSTFFFMTADPGYLDEGYWASSPIIRREVDRLREKGFAVGLHTGFGTLDHPDRVVVEKARLEAQLGHAVTTVRQHYLRIAVPRTWQIWEENGFQMDSSLGYSDIEGFRAGTCWDFPLYDLEQDRVLALVERPLVVMEGVLRVHRALSPAAARERILQLARRCRAVEGNFTLLWHNSSLWHEYRDWAGLYRKLLPELKALESR